MRENIYGPENRVVSGKVDSVFVLKNWIMTRGSYGHSSYANYLRKPKSALWYKNIARVGSSGEEGSVSMSFLTEDQRYLVEDIIKVKGLEVVKYWGEQGKHTKIPTDAYRMFLSKSIPKLLDMFAGIYTTYWSNRAVHGAIAYSDYSEALKPTLYPNEPIPYITNSSGTHYYKYGDIDTLLWHIVGMPIEVVDFGDIITFYYEPSASGFVIEVASTSLRSDDVHYYLNQIAYTGNVRQDGKRPIDVVVLKVVKSVISYEDLSVSIECRVNIDSSALASAIYNSNGYDTGEVPCTCVYSVLGIEYSVKGTILLSMAGNRNAHLSIPSFSPILEEINGATPLAARIALSDLWYSESTPIPYGLLYIPECNVLLDDTVMRKDIARTVYSVEVAGTTKSITVATSFSFDALAVSSAIRENTMLATSFADKTLLESLFMDDEYTTGLSLRHKVAFALRLYGSKFHGFRTTGWAASVPILREYEVVHERKIGHGWTNGNPPRISPLQPNILLAQRQHKALPLCGITSDNTLVPTAQFGEEEYVNTYQRLSDYDSIGTANVTATRTGFTLYTSYACRLPVYLGGSMDRAVLDYCSSARLIDAPYMSLPILALSGYSESYSYSGWQGRYSSGSNTTHNIAYGSKTAKHFVYPVSRPCYFMEAATQTATVMDADTLGSIPYPEGNITYIGETRDMTYYVLGSAGKLTYLGKASSEYGYVGRRSTDGAIIDDVQPAVSADNEIGDTSYPIKGGLRSSSDGSVFIDMARGVRVGGSTVLTISRRLLRSQWQTDIPDGYTLSPLLAVTGAVFQNCDGDTAVLISSIPGINTFRDNLSLTDAKSAICTLVMRSLVTGNSKETTWSFYDSVYSPGTASTGYIKRGFVEHDVIEIICTIRISTRLWRGTPYRYEFSWPVTLAGAAAEYKLQFHSNRTYNTHPNTIDDGVVRDLVYVSTTILNSSIGIYDEPISGYFEETPEEERWVCATGYSNVTGLEGYLCYAFPESLVYFIDGVKYLVSNANRGYDFLSEEIGNLISELSYPEDPAPGNAMISLRSRLDSILTTEQKSGTSNIQGGTIYEAGLLVLKDTIRIYRNDFASYEMLYHLIGDGVENFALLDVDTGKGDKTLPIISISSA